MSSWNKRRRVESVIHDEKPDRLPVALWRHWPGDDQDAEALAAAHLKWYHDYDWDLLKVGPDSNYSVADWGVKDRWVGHIEGTRETIYWPIKSVEDWASLQTLDPQQGKLAMQIETLSLVRQGAGEDVPILATIFSPLSQAKHLAGKEAIATHWRSHPHIFHKALDVITESTIRFVEAAKEAGIDGIFYAVQHARYPLMSREEFAEFGRSYDLRVLEAAQELPFNMLHIHSTDIMFDLVADYPVHMINWHDRESGVSLKEGLAQINGAASGGIDHWTIHQESPEQMLVEAGDAIEQTGGRRLLLGTGCVVMNTTPLRNLRALREFAEAAKV
ncbi:MAG: uroporphyrinogen decarboxylase family protein [Candidatus Promineifilaceae bacterium]